MEKAISQYIQKVNFSEKFPDETSWEGRLLDMGLDREAFCVIRENEASAAIKFWEPDRFEALRFLARLETLPS